MLSTVELEHTTDIIAATLLTIDEIFRNLETCQNLHNRLKKKIQIANNYSTGMYSSIGLTMLLPLIAQIYIHTYKLKT